MAVRVLRLMEYVYPDADTAFRDMERWAVQGTMFLVNPSRRDHCIRSTALPPTLFEPTDSEGETNA